MDVTPAGHGAHCRSATSVGSAVTYVLGAHVVHAAQLAAFDVALKPFEHAEHVRSVVALPLVATWLPAAQLDQATHAVSARPS